MRREAICSLPFPNSALSKAGVFKALQEGQDIRQKEQILRFPESALDRKWDEVICVDVCYKRFSRLVEARGI